MIKNFKIPIPKKGLKIFFDGGGGSDYFWI